MPDFEEMARRARAAHEQSEAEKQAQAREESAKRDADFEVAAKALLEFAEPLFEQAREAFGKAGAPCVISDNWRQVQHGRPMRPEITFQCVGPRTRNSMGGSFEAKGLKVFASYDGENYRIGRGDDTHSNHIGKDTKTLSEPDEQALSEYLEIALKTYFEDHANHLR